MKKAFLICIGLCMPGFGVVFCIMYLLIEYFTKQKEGKIKTLVEDIANKKSVRKPKHSDHLVAVSEALALNDTKIKKEVLIDVLREDKSKFIRPLKQALHNQDTEASHYAAVALMEIKDELYEGLEINRSRLKENPENLLVLQEYASFLKQNIKSDLNDAMYVEALVKEYTVLLERLLNFENIASEYYEDKIEMELRLDNFETAYTYCLKFKAIYNESEKPYFCLMNYYYERKDILNLRKVIEELKASSITLSREGIQNIRFWLEGMV